jgi:hypothetical protein
MTNRSQNNDQPHVLDGLLMYDTTLKTVFAFVLL